MGLERTWQPPAYNAEGNPLGNLLGQAKAGSRPAATNRHDVDVTAVQGAAQLALEKQRQSHEFKMSKLEHEQGLVVDANAKAAGLISVETRGGTKRTYHHVAEAPSHSTPAVAREDGIFRGLITKHVKLMMQGQGKRGREIQAHAQVVKNRESILHARYGQVRVQQAIGDAQKRMRAANA